MQSSRGYITTASAVWHNPRPREHGFRLTSAARLVLANTGVKSYTYDLKVFLRNQDLVDLDNHFIFPFFIENYKKIVVYSEESAVMLTLYSGDLRAYLATLKFN